MFQNLEIFEISSAMARHAGRRQAHVAQNMANADTPNFNPKDLTPFSDQVRRASSISAPDGHTYRLDPIAQSRTVVDRDSPSSPNGNSVSLEGEMLRAVDVKRQHDRALTVYRHAMTILRASLGRQ